MLRSGFLAGVILSTTYQSTGIPSSNTIGQTHDTINITSTLQGVACTVRAKRKPPKLLPLLTKEINNILKALVAVNDISKGLKGSPWYFT